MDADRFYGAWNLVSQFAYRANGDIYYPRGEDAIGRIMYDSSGSMAVQLMRVNHPLTDLTSYQTAMQGYLAYFGAFSVDEQSKIVTHAVQGATYAPYIGTELKRFYEFSEDDTKLTLTAEPDTANPQSEKRVLVWQRVVTRS